MSSENDEKKEAENKLMEDHKESDKNYGTDDRVILPFSGETQSSNEPDIEAGPQTKGQIKREKSLIKRIRSIEPKNTHLGFLSKIVSFIFDTITGIIALFIANIIQISCIAIGSIYIHDCPIQPGIPIILVISGSINILVCIGESVKRRVNKESHTMKQLESVMNVLRLASFIIFLCWIYFVYDTYYKDYTFEENSIHKYCNKTCFLFAFWLLNIYLIIGGIILFFTCCCCCLTIGGAVTAAAVSTSSD